MISAATEPTFRALADPTRRAILEILLEGECAQCDLQPSFAMSQPALSQHLKQLCDAGLVERRRDGRRTLYCLHEEGLGALEDWLLPFQEFWSRRLQGLGDYLRRME